MSQEFINYLSPSLRFIMKSLIPFKWWILGLLTAASLYAVDLTIRPYIVKLIINNSSNLGVENSSIFLQNLAAIYVIISFFMVLVQRTYQYMWMNINCGLKKNLGLQLLNLQMEKNKIFFEGELAGNLSSKTKDVMSGIPDIINILIDKFYSRFLSIIIAIFVLWQTNSKFALGLILWIILYVNVSVFYASKGKQYCMNSASSRSKTFGFLVDIITNLSIVRLFNGQKNEYKKFSNHLDIYINSDRKRDLFFLSLFSYQGLSFVLYQGACLFWLVFDLKSALITTGDLALILLINNSIISSLVSLSWELNKFSITVGDVLQALKIFLVDPEIKNKKKAHSIISAHNNLTHPKIRIEKISFSYKNTPPLFENLSLEIMPQQKVGIVGYSGSGKTTFINLLIREFDVTKGAIYIDDKDIRSITLESLRENIGVVPQDSMLFHRSLRENIRYGKMTASDDEIIMAAKKVQLHEFISQLSLGYDSIVGERGMKLSGGQRQRIGIARVILKDAPILIFDEATSQMDSITEKHIQTELFQIMNRKLTIVIAHRLSTLLSLDRILVFSQGAIVGDGTHTELLESNIHYRKLWSAQIGGFLPTLPYFANRQDRKII